MPVPTFRLFAGLAKETTWGTAVPATTFYPILKPKHAVKYQTILDQGFRSNAAKDQGWFQGTAHTEIDYPDMMFYPDDSGHLFMGMLGTDTISGAGPYTHTITLLNSALPPSYTLVKFDALLATARSVAGSYMEDVTLKFAHRGALTVGVKARGKIEANVTAPSNTYSSAPILMPWQGALTLGGGSNAKLIDFSLNIKRPVELIFGINNSQDATAGNVGPIEVTGKMTFVPTDFTEINYYLNNTQPATSIVFTSGTNTLTLQMTKTAFEDPTELDHGSAYAKISASFRAIANATDAGTGNSPLKVIAVNGKAAAY